MPGIRIKTGHKGDPVQEFLADWAALHRLLTPHVPDHATVRGDLRLEDNRVSVEYVVPEEAHDQAYKLAYSLFRRNGATCRIAAIERIPFDQPHSMIAALDGVRDAPGLDILGARPVEPRENPGWTLLRGILYLGARSAFNR
jgi:hypothetical protein